MSSLRRDIHSAFEEIAPPLGGMPERVVQTVLADKRRRRKERMVYRLRFSLELVAAVLIVAVAVAALVTWNALHNNPSPAGPPVHLTPLQQLEARPLVMPRASSQQTCTDHPGTNSLGFSYGDGPVYGDGGLETPSSWGYYWDVTYYVAANVRGPILIRGQDLMTGKSMVFVGSQTEGTVTGPVAGTDPSQSPSTLRTELVLDPTKFPRRTDKGLGWFAVRQGLPKDYVGCFGIQIDGPTFKSEWVSSWVAP